MTTTHKPVTRETCALIRDGGRCRPLIASLTHGGLALRQKGCRRAYLLPYAAAWGTAVKLAVAAERAARRKDRT